MKPIPFPFAVTPPPSTPAPADPVVGFPLCMKCYIMKAQRYTCVPYTMFCDGHTDCIDWMDENVLNCGEPFGVFVIVSYRPLH